MSNENNPFSFEFSSPEDLQETNAVVVDTTGGTVTSSAEIEDINNVQDEEDQDLEIIKDDDAVVIDVNNPLNVEGEEQEEPTDPTIEPESTVETSTEDTDEETEDEGTLAYILAQSFLEDGVFEEEEVSKDISALELKQKLVDTVQREARELLTQERDADENTIQVLDYIKKGGNLQALQDAYSYKPLISLDTEDTSDNAEYNRKQLILNMYQDKNISKERAEKFYDTLFKTGEDAEEAEVAKEYFKELESARVNSLIEEQKNYETQRVENLQKAQDNVKSIISSGSLGDISLNKDEQSRMIAALYNKSEKVVVQNQEGKKFMVKKSKAELLMDELQKDPITQLKFIYNVLVNKKPSISKEVNEEELELKVTKKALSKLNSKQTNQATPKKRNTKNKFQEFYSY